MSSDITKTEYTQEHLDFMKEMLPPVITVIGGNVNPGKIYTDCVFKVEVEFVDQTLGKESYITEEHFPINMPIEYLAMLKKAIIIKMIELVMKKRKNARLLKDVQGLVDSSIQSETWGERV